MLSDEPQYGLIRSGVLLQETPLTRNKNVFAVVDGVLQLHVSYVVVNPLLHLNLTVELLKTNESYMRSRRQDCPRCVVG